jgi:hypothetical protein
MVDMTDEQLLDHISSLLASGLKTQTEPFPEDSDKFNEIVRKLQDIPKDDVERKLVVSGFLDHPVEEMRCLECMYYLPHRQWCNLPEIDLPAKQDWWCRLWRI